MRRSGVTGESIDGAIAAALFELLASEDLAHVTVSQIARKAAIDRATFYRHFSGKDDVVRRFYRRYLDGFVRRFRESGSADVGSYLLLMFQTTVGLKEQMLALHRAGASPLLLPVLAEAFGAGRLADAPDPRVRYAVAYHVGGIYNDLLLWFDRDMAETPEQMLDVALAVRPEGAFTLLNL